MNIAKAILQHPRPWLGRIILAAAGAGLPLFASVSAAAADEPTIPKCVVMDLWKPDPNNPGPNQAGLKFAHASHPDRTNLKIIQESGTTWVRMWARWRYAQENPPSTAFPAPAGAHIDFLDQQIDFARAAGLRVILTAIEFPEWANSRDNPATVNPNEFSRFAPYKLETGTMWGHFPFTYSVLYSTTNLVPQHLGPTSDWGNWIDFLIRRYGDRIDFLELCNEPNLAAQMWPYYDAHGAPLMPRRVAQMFVTAKEKLRAAKADPRIKVKLAGAAADDNDHPWHPPDATHPLTRQYLSNPTYYDFTKALIKELKKLDFKADADFAWSLHNYRDVEHSRKGIPPKKTEANPTVNTNAVAWTRQYLVKHGWTGWPSGNADSAKILITEGGARLVGAAKLVEPDAKARPNLDKGYNGKLKQKQASLVAAAFNRLVGQKLGAGVGLFTQYLTFSDPSFDSGLFDIAGDQAVWAARNSIDPCTNDPAAPGGGAERPLYKAWTDLKGEPVPPPPVRPPMSAF